MNKICLVATYRELVELAEELKAELDLPIDIVQGDLEAPGSRLVVLGEGEVVGALGDEGGQDLLALAALLGAQHQAHGRLVEALRLQHVNVLGIDAAPNVEMQRMCALYKDRCSTTRERS